MEYIEVKQKLDNESLASINLLKEKFADFRTRASSGLVAHIVISAYGQQIPISQLAMITTSDANTIKLQVYDKKYIKDIAKQISITLDLNPQYKGQHIIVNLPTLTEERRTQYVKRAKQYSEATKIAIRMHRKNAMNSLTKSTCSMSQDDLKKYRRNIEDQVFLKITEIDNMLKDKTREIMSI